MLKGLEITNKFFQNDLSETSESPLYLYCIHPDSPNSLTTIKQECCEQYQTSPGGSTLQSIKTTQVRRTRHAAHCWRSRDWLISDILRRTSSHGRAEAGRPARTYIQQLCANTGCGLNHLTRAMDDRDGWRERVMEVCDGGTTWWWWWWWTLSNSSALSHKLISKHSEIVLQPSPWMFVSTTCCFYVFADVIRIMELLSLETVPNCLWFTAQ